jgi:hypothetical protein
MRETAIGLAARGFKVFPITAGAKAPPLISAWQTYATTDPHKVESWWKQWPDANVGIHCDGLVVIDVDPKSGGKESLAALEKEIQLDATYEVDTPSGGVHVYYRCPAGAAVRNGVSVLGAGLDIRTAGGYVLGAGSTLAHGGYTVGADEAIEEVPAAILARLKAVPAKPERPKGNEPAIQTDPEYAAHRAIEYLESLPMVQAGGRNVALMHATRKIGDFGVTVDQAVPLLSTHFRCEPPMEEHEIVTTVHSSYRGRETPQGSNSPESSFEVLKEEEVPTPESGEGGGEKPSGKELSEMLHPADVVHKDVLHSEYLVKRVLDRGSNAVLFGKWNVGKTFVVLDMAASIACGLPWFGNRVKQGRVLYLGYEGIRAMKKRMIALRGKYPKLMDKKVPFRWAPLHNPLTGDIGKMELNKAIRTFKELHGGPPDLVIIDPLMNALGGDDSDAKLMGLLNVNVANLMRAEKCAVLRVHHTGHGSEERARGHSSLPAGIDTEVRVDRDHIALTKQRDDVLKQFDFDLKEVAIGIDQDGESVTTMVVEQLEDNPCGPALARSLRELLDELLKQYGDGGMVKANQINKCCPEHLPADQKVKMRETLVRKQYLIPEPKEEFRISKVGPAPQFETVAT